MSPHKPRRPLIGRRVRILNTIGMASVTATLIAVFILLVINVHHLSTQITRSRAKNVATWCQAINHDRKITRSYIQQRQQVDKTLPAINLPDLNCQLLIHRTVMSNH